MKRECETTKAQSPEGPPASLLFSDAAPYISSGRPATCQKRDPVVVARSSVQSWGRTWQLGWDPGGFQVPPLKGQPARLSGWATAGPFITCPENRNCGSTATSLRNFFNLIWDTEDRVPPQCVYRDVHGKGSKPFPRRASSRAAGVACAPRCG